MFLACCPWDFFILLLSMFIITNHPTYGYLHRFFFFFFSYEALLIIKAFQMQNIFQSEAAETKYLLP